MKEMKEAEIWIGNTRLSIGQSLTVRVAVGSMLIQLDDKEHLKKLGQIGLNYVERLLEIQELIMKNIKK